MLNEDSKSSNSQPIEILLVDDHPLIRRLLHKIIECYKDLKVVGEAINGEEAVLLAARLKPAVVIMDIHLPILSGISASTLIKSNNPFGSVIALTAGGPCQDEKAMNIAGEAAVIKKDEVLHALHPAIISAVKQVNNPVGLSKIP